MTEQRKERLLDKVPKPKMTPDQEIHVGEMMFVLAHHVEKAYGLAGIRYMKRWAIEKLPEKAFERGHFGTEAKP